MQSVDPAELVRTWRQAVGLSQRALAEAVGSSQAAISRIERGEQEPTVSELRAIGDACGYDVRVMAFSRRTQPPAELVQESLSDLDPDLRELMLIQIIVLRPEDRRRVARFMKMLGKVHEVVIDSWLLAGDKLMAHL